MILKLICSISDEDASVGVGRRMRRWRWPWQGSTSSSLTYLICSLSITMTLCMDFQNHTIISISGWPQSGTSFINDFLSHIPGFSTMIEKCPELQTEKNCLRFNHEGQWMLPVNVKNYLHSGEMCSLSANDANSQISNKLRYWWGEAWNETSPFLVEKSPQNILKLPFFDQVFSDAKTVKHLIIIKHPITLNIALPKKVTWKIVHEYCNKESLQKRQSFMKNSRYSEEYDIHRALRFFFELLDGGLSQYDHLNMSCLASPPSRRNFGWIQTLNSLSNWLNTNRQDTLENTRILRYEDFVGHSSIICVKILSFFYSLPISQESYLVAYISPPKIRKILLERLSNPKMPFKEFIENNAQSQVIYSYCTKLFPFSSNPRISSRTQGKRILRLHHYSDPNFRANLTFQPEIAKKSSQSRLVDYQKVYQDCVDGNSKRIIDKFDREILKFGYSFTRKRYYPYASNQSVFDDWDLGRDLLYRSTPSDMS